MFPKCAWLLTAGAMMVALGCGRRSEDPKTTITIAAVGPLTGAAAERGKDLSQAVRMAVDEANAAGGIGGRSVHLNLYDDADQPSQARELALKIAATPAVAVLGQVASQAGIVAGRVYKDQEIPAITGAASQSLVTKDNGWYFRLLPDAAGQGAFLADYARLRFGAREIVILRETGTAGEEFALALRDRAKSEGIRIAADLAFPPSDVKSTAALDAIAEKLAKVPKGDIIVFGTQYADTPQLLRALREKRGPFPSMGYSSVATDGLNAPFAQAERTRRTPGFYTDDLTVAAPQLPDVAGYPQTVFASRYKARYGVEPTPEAVRWYEGARLIFQAIAETGPTGQNQRADRHKIRDWLASLNRPEAAAPGVGGPIYFDKDGNVQRGFSVGVFHGGHLISSPVQFTPVSDPTLVPGWEKLSSNGMIATTGDVKFVKTPVVYAGIDLNSLDNIDVRANSFQADFFVWFRSQQDTPVDPHEVEFPTALSGGQLGLEVLRRTHDGFTTSTYHVKGTFRAEYEFARFPFDSQTLRIPIQFRNSTNYSVILAYGGNGGAVRAAEGGQQTTRSTSRLASRLWKLKNEIFYRDVVAYESSFGEQVSAQRAGVEFNRINAAITIERDVFGYAVKNFLPLGCILIAVLIGYALAADVINPRVSIGVTALLTTSVLYQKMASELPSVTYIIAIDYVFFAFFAFCVTFLALTVVTYETHKTKKQLLTKRLNQWGTAMTVAGLAGTLLFVWMRYWGQGQA